MSPYVVTSCFWQIVDHWQTLITGIFALVAGGVAYLAGLKQADATTRASNDQIAAAARKDRLQARCIAVGIFPELMLLQVLHEKAVAIIAEQFPLVKASGLTAQIVAVIRSARIEIPPLLLRNVDHFYLVEPGGPSLLQLVSFTMRYNGMIDTLAHQTAQNVDGFDPRTHRIDLGGVLTLIERALEDANREIAPLHDEATA